MINSADVARIHLARHEESDSSVMLGWVGILVITVIGFSALAYAIGKHIGMGVVCR